MGEGIYDERHRVLIDLMVEARREAGLTQTALAERLGGSQQVVSFMESGQRRIDVVELHEFCEIVGVDLLDFVTRYVERTVRI